MTIQCQVLEIAQEAKKAASTLCRLATEEKNLVLREMGDALLKHESFLREENSRDVAFASEKGCLLYTSDAADE